MSDARQRWAERLTRYHASGQTIAAFCAAEGVSEPSFYAWKRKLALTPPPTTLVPIQITASPADAIELVLTSGPILRFPSRYSPHDLATIVATLEARSC